MKTLLNNIIAAGLFALALAAPVALIGCGGGAGGFDSGAPGAWCASDLECLSGVCVRQTGQCAQCAADADCPGAQTCVSQICVGGGGQQQQDASAFTDEPDTATSFEGDDSGGNTTGATTGSTTDRPGEDETTDPGSGETHWRVREEALERFAHPDAVDAVTGYPLEDLDEPVVRPDVIGLRALLLATLIEGAEDAQAEEQLAAELSTLLLTLHAHQEAHADRGLLPWLSLRDGARRWPEEAGQRVALVENATLAWSLGAAAGALAGWDDGQPMIAVIEAILERQRPGFEALLSCDEATGACRFRRGWSLTEARPWLADAHPDTFGEGHWAALAFVVARFELAPAALEGLAIDMAPCPTEAPRHCLLALDGGAFQALGPALALSIPDGNLKALHQRFLSEAIAFSTEHDLRGLLSPTTTAPGDVTQAIGVAALSMRVQPPPDPSTPSLYALGAAFAVDPERTARFMDELERGSTFKDLEAPGGGYWDGFTADLSPIAVRSPLNLLRLTLGLGGAGPRHLARYLGDRQLDLQWLFEPGAPAPLLPATLDGVIVEGATAERDAEGALLLSGADTDRLTVTALLPARAKGSGQTLRVALTPANGATLTRVTLALLDAHGAVRLRARLRPEGGAVEIEVPEFPSMNDFSAWTLTVEGDGSPPSARLSALELR